MIENPAGDLTAALPDEGGAQSLFGSLLRSFGSGPAGAGGHPLEELLDSLDCGGLGEQARSWVGPGENESVTGAELAWALPMHALEAAARGAGLSEGATAELLALLLPDAVDRLAVDGQVPGVPLEEMLARYYN